ncbi:unnamed protein product [Moneuplotes crassus]|uniref:Chromatin assembly factor 1 subunit A dimerization domain-containing protein n=1 Tax=Euplotes crassus TaxID=5936 RepID=A0AAD2CZ28_EUPCR|nr:unnamed protein product [Moneuplotes crassus]
MSTPSKDAKKPESVLKTQNSSTATKKVKQRKTKTKEELVPHSRKTPKPSQDVEMVDESKEATNENLPVESTEKIQKDEENLAPNMEKSAKKNKRKSKKDGTARLRKRIKTAPKEKDQQDGTKEAHEDEKEIPASSQKPTAKLDTTQKSTSKEEKKVSASDSNQDGGKTTPEEEASAQPKQSKRGRKIKATMQDSQPSVEIKREKKLIEKLESQLSDLIKAGIDCKLNLEPSMREKHKINLGSLSEFIKEKDSIDLKDPETQIIFIQTFSFIIDSSSLPLQELVRKCIQTLAQLGEEVSSKVKAEDFETFIKENSERKIYGKLADTNDTLNDATPESLYCWEIVNTALMDGAVVKDINLVRASRGFIGDKIRSLTKLIKLINKATKDKDLEKIQNEKEKFSKIDKKETAHAQKVTQRILQIKEKEEKEAQKQLKKQQIELAKEMKEKQKREEAERKKKLEAEAKQKKKEEQARIKKEQEEAKKKKQEEIQRQKELKKQKEEEERKKKEEEIRLQKEKEESAQTKLACFFKKSAPPKPAPKAQSSIPPPSSDTKPSELLSDFILKCQKSPPITPQEIKSHLKDTIHTSRTLKNAPKCPISTPNSRKKDIFIEGSYKKLSCVWHKKSHIITPRNPFKMDEALIDYDMDSEDEFEEENGEDINSDKEDDDEDMGEDDEEDGWIVPDGYLSRSEKNDDDLELDKDPKENRIGYTEVKKERKFDSVIQPVINVYQGSGFEEFKIISANPQILFPLVISAKDFDQVDDEDDKKDSADPNAIKKKMKEFILMVHGSYEAKFKLIEEFAKENPECSKASIERTIREVSSKEKEFSQSKFRYIVTQEAIDASEVDKEELQKIFDARFAVVQEEIDQIEREKQEEKQKEREEKERIKAIEREKKEEAKRIEKEKKQAEKLKIKQEKERLKQKEKEEKLRLKEEKKKEKQKDKGSKSSTKSETDTDAPKRSRGRPKGSKNKAKLDKPVVESSQVEMTAPPSSITPVKAPKPASKKTEKVEKPQQKSAPSSILNYFSKN